jgi:hypothetical protein
MANNPADESLATLAAPLSELIAAVGRGLGDAQKALDQSSIESIKALHAGNDTNVDVLRRLGYQPTWYRIPELDAEITASLSVSRRSKSAGVPGQLQMYMSPVDATYSNSYDYDLQAATVLRFKVVAVPPPARATDMKVMPPVVGMLSQKAREKLADMGIPFVVAGTGGYIAETIPPAGELITDGEKAQLTLGND